VIWAHNDINYITCDNVVYDINELSFWAGKSVFTACLPREMRLERNFSIN
jgi:hypothetical protein